MAVKPGPAERRELKSQLTKMIDAGNRMGDILERIRTSGEHQASEDIYVDINERKQKIKFASYSGLEEFTVDFRDAQGKEYHITFRGG